MEANRQRGRAEPAIVLRTYKFGEADRVVVLLSQDNGKLRAVAKGVRKATSRFGSKLEPGSCVKAELYRGKSELYTVTGVELLVHHRQIRADLNRLFKLARMLEVADAVCLDEVPHPGLYKILKGALDTLEAEDSVMLLAGFLWRVLQHEGMAPEHQACSLCGSTEQLVGYDVREGGLVCAEHRQGKPLSPAARGALQAILGGRLRQALQLSDTAVAAELEQLAETVLQSHSERVLKSVKVAP